MQKLKIEGFKLAGIQLPGRTTNKNNQSNTDCGNLWQKFEKENIFDLIPQKISNTIYAVYFDFGKSNTDEFSYFIGCKVDNHLVSNEELDTLSIPEQEYEKFTAKGVMTGCLIDAWKAIWTSNIKRQYGYDFEVYDERSSDWNNAEVDIFVSVDRHEKT